MAAELNMEAKHSLEKQTAAHVDCFTTVSELTAKECELLLEVKPAIVTPNGFESNFVPKGKIFDEKRKIARQTLIKVAEQLVGESLSEDSFLLAISGRYEYKNKGIDLFIESMNRICRANPEKPMIAYILVPAWINGPRIDLQNRLKKNKSPQFPLHNPCYTHHLNFPEEDKVFGYLSYLDFLNQKECNIKIIFVPSYLNGDDGIFNLPYYDLLIGLDLTVFPSYYEPWGYTPLESIAFGIPTVTTNLAGFGLWAQKESKENNDFQSGVEVIDRTDDNYCEAAEKIKDFIIKYATALNVKQIQQTKKAAEALSKKASWSHFIEYYLDAYNLAFEYRDRRLFGMNGK
jgi:glycosyltransferase involved in cell wall biosynthesis